MGGHESGEGGLKMGGGTEMGGVNFGGRYLGFWGEGGTVGSQRGWGGGSL